MINLTKTLKTVCISVGLSGIFSVTAFAGQWVNGSAGWWYDNGDGTYPASTWKWIDGNGDNISECYYFDANGYCVLNGVTPDGYQVDQNGAWIESGVVQTKVNQAVTGTQFSITDSTKRDLGKICFVIYEIYFRGGAAYSMDIRLSDMTLAEQSDFLDGYQYFCTDPRFVLSGEGEYHVIKNIDLKDVISELFGTSSKVTVEKSDGYSEFFATGSYGDAGLSYLSQENLSFSMDNGRVKVEGNIRETKNYSDYYAGRKFTAYFIPNNGLSLGGYRFDQLIVE